MNKIKYNRKQSNQLVKFDQTVHILKINITGNILENYQADHSILLHAFSALKLMPWEGRTILPGTA